MFVLKIVVFLILTFLILRPIYMGYLYTRPPRIKIFSFTPALLGVPYEDVRLKASDGVSLVGWYVHSRNSAAVILLHGHSGNRLAVLPPAEALIEAGYGVLMFDLRAHGSSGGKRFARSQQLVDDVLTAVAFLSHRPEVNAAGIGVFGVSVGGTMALHAAARTVAIRAVAVDGPAPAVVDDMPTPASLVDRLLRWPMQKYFMKVSAFFGDERPLASMADVLSRLAPRPLLFIAPGRGLIQRLVRRLHAAAPAPKSLWAIPAATRGAGWTARPDEYGQHLVRFFDYALVSARHKETAVLPPPPVDAHLRHHPDYEVVDDATISMLWANVVALLMIPLVLLLFFLPYRWLWGEEVLDRSLPLDLWSLGGIVLLFVGSILLHEWLHAVGFRRVGGAPKTAVTYGFSWKGLAPYAHCKAPLKAGAYRVSIWLPGVVLGLIPGLVGLVTGLWWLVLWASLMLVAAGGDAAVLLAIHSVPSKALVLDHPERAGCQIVKKRV